MEAATISGGRSGSQDALFWSSLDKTETKQPPDTRTVGQRHTDTLPRDDDPRHAVYDYEQLCPLSPDEECFRHSGWAMRRKRVHEALARCAVPMNRIARFACCGCQAYVQRSPSTGRVRVTSSFCHDRFCVPCSRSRARAIIDQLLVLMGKETHQFITVTQAPTNEPLNQQITKLWGRVSILRGRKFWRDRVKGGAMFVEVKKGKGSRLWHVHAHMIVKGGTISKWDLSKEWKAVTGDSFIVDAQIVDSPERLRKYVTKYVTKGIDDSVLVDPSALDQCILGMRGRRLCSTFGAWRGCDVERERDDPGDWRTIGSLDSIAQGAREGNLGCILLLEIIKTGKAVLPASALPQPPPPN